MIDFESHDYLLRSLLTHTRVNIVNGGKLTFIPILLGYTPAFLNLLYHHKGVLLARD